MNLITSDNQLRWLMKHLRINLGIQLTFQSSLKVVCIKLSVKEVNTAGNVFKSEKQRQTV